MSAPIVSHADLQRVHRDLRITVPLDQASPLLLATLAVVAHCWRKRTGTTTTTVPARHVPSTAVRLADDTKQKQPIDLKRRAAGDFD